MQHLSWGDEAWPFRRIINMVATDAGELNWQMECGHVAWLRGMITVAKMGAVGVWRSWEGGNHEMMTRCRGCYYGLPAPHPIGVTLPIVLPTQHQHGEVRT